MEVAKIYIAEWCSCEKGGYNYSEGILSVHSTLEGAQAACAAYEKEYCDDSDMDWADIEIKDLLP